MVNKRRLLTAREQVDIIDAYRNGLEPMIALAKKYGITRQGIWKLLVRAGVERVEVFDVSCTACGRVFKRTRDRVRKQRHHFCCQSCYFAFLEAGNGKPLLMNRHSSRLARAIVAKFFDLQPGHIVHHKDRNQFNNSPSNLMVFAGNGDHVRHHRGLEATPLWDGDTA